MTMKQNLHALHVVEAFKQKLSAETITVLGEGHLDELALLIESAISAAVLEEMEKTADKVDRLAHNIRQFAEHFDPE
jgi:hypothetical protein